MKNNKHEKRIKFIINNNLSVAEAAEVLDINESTIYYSLKHVSKNLRDKFDLMIALKKKKKGKKKFLYEKRAEQIIKDKSITSYTVAYSKLNVKRGSFRDSMKLLQINNLKLYNKLKETMKSRRKNEVMVKKIIKYCSKNHSCTRQDVVKYLKCNNTQLANYIHYMKANYSEKHEEIITLFKKNKNTKYKQYGNYLLENNCSFKEAAKHFNVSEKTISSSYYVDLRLNDFELYNSIRLMRIIKKNLKK